MHGSPVGKIPFRGEGMPWPSAPATLYFKPAQSSRKAARLAGSDRL
jgi:hypothetical protein